MKLILDTLEAARLTASPSDAMTLADALTDLGDLADVLAALGMTLDDVLPALGERQALRDHVAARVARPQKRSAARPKQPPRQAVLVVVLAGAAAVVVVLVVVMLVLAVAVANVCMPHSLCRY